MNRRQKIIVSVVGIFIVLLALVGLTYAYFLTQVKGNTNNKSISVTTANLRLVYGGDDGSIIGDNEIIEPDTTFAPKTFTVSNEGNEKIDSYAVVIENFGVYYNEDSTIIENNVEVPVYANDVTKLSRPEDFEIVITCKNQDEEDCTGYNGALPTESAIMLTNSIEVDEVQTYTATLTYKEAGTNQSADMNKRIEGKFNIIGLTDTVDLTGTVTSYQKGDYVQTNSTKRVSAINPDGTYKVLGLEAGEHKIKVCARDEENPEIKDCSDEEAKMIQTINIVKGETASGNNTTKTITITEDSREATVNVDATAKSITIESEIKEIEKPNGVNPYAEGTLAYNIINNSIQSLNGTTYREQPLTEVGISTSRIPGEGQTLNISKWYYHFSGGSSASIVGTYANTCTENMIGATLYTGELWMDDGVIYDKIVGCTSDGKPIVANFVDDEKTLSITEDDFTSKTGKNSYYYRGAVADNYVDFAGMCWRIVRIDGEGNIKLILQDKNNVCRNSSANYYIKTFDSYGDEIPMIKFSEGTMNLDDFLNFTYQDEPNAISVIKSFQDEFSNNELNKMASGNWCYNGGETGTLKCDGTKLNNFKDTNETPMYVAAITTNEAILAGGTMKSGNANYYLFDSSDSFPGAFFTLSADAVITYQYEDGGYTYGLITYVGANSSCITYPLYTGVRPMIMLAKGALWASGDGTKTNAYTINMN